jgi:glycosyltransferase involved in cell wall biosynthesis
MKVLVVQPHGMAPGPSEFSFQYSAALHEAGHEVIIATASGLITRSDDEIPWRHLQALPPESNLAFGRAGGANFFRRKFSTLRSNIKTLALALRAARNETIDVVHVIDGELISLCLVNLRFRRPGNLFFTYRGYEMGSIGRNPIANIYQLLRRMLWKVAASNIHIDAETSQAAGQLESAACLPANTVEVIAHPIWSADEFKGLSRSDARDRLGITHDDPIFLVFGHRPALQKAIDTLVIGARKLPSQVRFLIAGHESDTQADKALRRLIAENSVEERFEWHDQYIPNELVESYFSASDALILSYRRTYLGASGVLSQAATYGLPVIASDSADLGSVVRSKSLGLTFETANPEAFTNTAREFVDLPEYELTKFKENLSQLRTDRSWSNIINRHVEFYSSEISLLDR